MNNFKITNLDTFTRVKIPQPIQIDKIVHKYTAMIISQDETILIDTIIEFLKKNGYTTVDFINKEFIATAIENEMKRREIKIKMDNKLKECLDILAKMEFFNQRAGRELWFDKPKNIQDKDIKNYNRDINTLREYILKQEEIK